MDDGGREDRICFAPSPAVEKAGDRREDDVPPVRESSIGNVGQPEKERSRPPAGQIAFRGARQHILQQAAKQELFLPSGEKKNGQTGERKRFPVVPAWRERNEVQGFAEGNRDDGEGHEAGENEKSPVMAPADVVTDAVDAAKEHEDCERQI